MNLLSFTDTLDMDLFLQRPLNPVVMPETVAFEKSLARVFGVEEAVAVSSGTAALHCALVALGIGPGDEVLVPALSVIMSAVPILYQQACPVFVDCAPGRVDFDYEDLTRKLSPRTRAILPVYLWGCAYDMPRLMRFAERHQLSVIEDACQAHGSQWAGRYLGTWGTIGCFSMRDGKLLSTGEGGFLLTNDHDLADTCRAMRSHWGYGTEPEQFYQRLGYNYRLPELLALLGQKQLYQFDLHLTRRRWQSGYLLDELAPVEQLEPYPYAIQEQSNLFSPIFLLREPFATRQVAQQLAQHGVTNSVGTFGLKPVQEWGIFQQIERATMSKASSTPNATAFLSRALAITLLPHYAQKDLERIVATIKKTVAETAGRRSTEELV